MRINLVAFLLLTSTCLAQSAKIEKPEKIEAGKIAKFSASYEGDDLDWLVYPPVDYLDALDRTGDKKNFIAFVPQSGIEYMIQLEAYKVVDGKFSKAKDKLVFKIGGDPGPKPPDPPSPDNLSESAKKVQGWARSVGNKVEGKKLAENYATVSSSIAAGAYNNLSFLDARAKVVSDVYALNTKVTSVNEEWKTKFFVPLSEYTKQLDEQGKLDSLDKINQFFKEVQVGLEAM